MVFEFFSSYLAYIDATEALKLKENLDGALLVKAYFRQAKALAQLGFNNKAIEIYGICIKLEPSDNSLMDELKKIENMVDFLNSLILKLFRKTIPKSLMKNWSNTIH